MINVSEVVCTEVQNGPAAEIAQGADKNGTGTEELFAVLLAALSGGLFGSQGDATAVVPAGEQAAESGLCIGSDVAVQSDAGASVLNTAAGGVSAAGDAPAVLKPVPVPEGEARASSTQGWYVASMQHGDDETASVQPVPAIKGSEGDQPLMSAQPPARVVPVSSQAYPAGDGTADDQVVVASVEAAKNASATGEATRSGTGEVPRSATNITGAESRVSAPAIAAAEAEPGVQPPVLPNGSSAVQSGFAPVRNGLELGGEDNAMTGMDHEAESAAGQPGRGSADRLFLETLAHAQDGRPRGAMNVTRSNIPAPGSPGEARLTESIVEQTVRGVILSARGGSSELRVRLWPEHLGELHLRLVIKDNVLQLDVNTQSTMVKSVIESNLGQLRHALQHNGVDVGRVSVMVDPDLASGGRFSRQAPLFHPFENRWHRSFSGQQPEEDSSTAQWFRGARRRHLLCRIDLLA